MTDYISRADALAVTQYCKDPVKAIEELPGVGWIPVTERLPEYGEVLALSIEYDEYMVGHICETEYGNGAVCCGDGVQLYDVTHWMPLPEPPKEETT